MPRSLVEDLTAALRREDTLVIVGSGVSISATGGAPAASWTGLIKDAVAFCMAQKLAQPGWDDRVLAQVSAGDLDELLGAAEAISRKLGAPQGGLFRRWLRESIGALKVSSGDVLEALRDLGTPLATTNYDHLLEKVTGLPPLTWREGPELERALRGERKAILHLHGSWEQPESVILSIRDYEKILRDAHAQATERAIGALRTLVFVGCGSGLSDPNLGPMLRWVSQVFAHSELPHYLLTRDGDVPALEKEYPPTGKLRVVGYGKDFAALGPFLRSLVPAPAASVAGVEDLTVSGMNTGGVWEEPLPLPAPPPYCFGRESLLDELVSALLEPEVHPIPLLGPAGIGKSTASLAALHAPRVVERFGEHRHFIRCETCRTADELLALIARALRIPPGPTRRQRLLTRLGRTPTLLVLDNLETPWEEDGEKVEELLKELGACRSLALVASVRGRSRPYGPAWRKPFELKPLGREDARRAFLAIAGEQFEEDSRLGELLGVLDGIPLAIELLAYGAQAEPDLQGIWELWRSKRTDLLRRGESTGRLLSLEASYELSISSRRMTPQARHLLSLLALLPGGLRHEDLKVLPGALDPLASAGTLRKLGLAFDEAQRLRLLVPLREYVSAHHPPRASDLETLSTHYKSMAATLGPRVGREGGGEAVRQLTDELANLEAVLLQGLQREEPLPAIQAALDLKRLLVLSRRGTPLLLMRAREAAHRAGHLHEEAHCAFNLGKLSLAHANQEEAREHFGEALESYQRVGNTLGEAHCIRNMGKLALASAAFDEARQRFEEALPLYRRTRDVLGEAHCIRGLGEIALARAEHPKARQRFEEALALYRQAGSLLGEAGCLCNMGEVALACSEYPEACLRFEEALPLYRRVGDTLGEASGLFSLGEVALARSEHESARRFLEAALSLYRSVGDDSGEALCLRNLQRTGAPPVPPTPSSPSRLEQRIRSQSEEERTKPTLLSDTLSPEELDQNEQYSIPGEPGTARRLFRIGHQAVEDSQYKAARQWYLEALWLFREERDPVGEAACLVCLGEVSLKLSMSNDARSRFEKALLLTSEASYRARCHSGLGAIAMESNETEKAREHYERAVGLFRTEREDEVLERAYCLCNLGKVLLALSQRDEAQQHLEQALAIFRRANKINGQASCLRNLGKLALARGAQDEAWQHFEAALPLAHGLNDRLGEAICHRNLGELALARTRYEEARLRFEAALSLYRQLKDAQGEALCVRHLEGIFGALVPQNEGRIARKE